MDTTYLVIPAFLGGMLGGLGYTMVRVWRAEKKARRDSRSTVLPLVYGPFKGARRFDTVMGPYDEDIPIRPPFRLVAGERILFDMTHTPRFGVYDGGKQLAVYRLSDDGTAYHKQ